METIFRKNFILFLTFFVIIILNLVLAGKFAGGLKKEIQTGLKKIKINIFGPEPTNAHEVFGFASYWTLGKLDNVDFNVLTTLAYFDVKVNADGSLARDDY